MISIVKATEKDSALLAGIGARSFVESHGSSASAADIDQYVSEKYTEEIFRNDLKDPGNVYHLIYHEEKPAGYSKVIFNHPPVHAEQKNITKLERLYLLQEFYDLKLGLALFNFNVELSKQNGQGGIWLFVWKGNHRAVRFYEKAGFQIIGSHDFRITETHSNPNHQMLLTY